MEQVSNWRISFLISKNFNKYFIINTDLILINNKISINSGNFLKLIFKIFKFFLIETININNIFNKFSKN